MVLMRSPTALNIPHGTQDIPHGTHDIPHGTHDIPHGTEGTLYRVDKRVIKCRKHVSVNRSKNYIAMTKSRGDDASLKYKPDALSG